MGKVIHGELRKKFKFDPTNKLYMHQPESVLENETQKILSGFQIQADHLISARQPDLVIVNKKKENFAVPVDHRLNWRKTKKDKYLDIARELKKNYRTWKWQ